VQRTFIVPIEFCNLPEGLQVADPKPSYAEVTMSGPENAFTLLDPAMVAVSLDLQDSKQPPATTWSTSDNLTNTHEKFGVVDVYLNDDLLIESLDLYSPKGRLLASSNVHWGVML